jgi:hypothetical protein
MEKAYFFKTNQLVIWRPSGILTTNKITEFITFLDVSSEQRDPHFSRFIDLTQIAGISVNYQDLHPIASQRKNYHNIHIKQRVKMAFLVNNPLAYGMARMYQILSDDPHFDVTIYENIEEAAAFLGVDIGLIRP